MTTKEQTIVFNDSTIYAEPIKWRTDIKEEPITETEKALLANTKTAIQLLEEEKEEKPLELTDEQLEKIKRRDYITRVKIVSLHNIGKHPLYNTSYLSQRDKRTLIKQMEEVMKLSDDEILTNFNDICNDELFNVGADVSTYPVYNHVVYDA